jgi:hypothetical protein
MLSPCDSIELVRCIGPSIIELPRRLTSHSSLKRPKFCCATDCDSGEEVAGLPGVDPKSVPAVDSARLFVRGALLAPYPRSSCDCDGGGTTEVVVFCEAMVTENG